MAQKRVRWGLLSTARINERLIPVIRDSARCELLAVASGGGLEKAQRYAQKENIPRAYGTYEALLADEDVDAVYISLPNALHAEWVVQAAAAGKHILCEKPLALTLEEIDRMAEAAAANGVILQEAITMRYHPQTGKLRELISQGAIGDVRLIRGLFTFVLNRPGDIRFDPALGGGCLWDLGGYCVSLMRWVLVKNPVEVQGWQISSDSGVDLSFTGHMRFASGTAAHFLCSFQATAQTQADFIGSEGTIHLDLPWLTKVGRPSHVRIARRGKAVQKSTFGDDVSQLDVETLTYDNVNAYRCEVDAMTACILDGADPVVPLADSRDNLVTVLALYKSAQENKPIRL